MNIDDLNIAELVSLRESVSIRLQSLVEARQAELKAEVESLAAINGETVLKPSKRPVKYRDGTNTWSGSGNLPSWLSAKKALGEDIEKFRV